jgi:hypothetical protein
MRAQFMMKMPMRAPHPRRKSGALVRNCTPSTRARSRMAPGPSGPSAPYRRPRGQRRRDRARHAPPAVTTHTTNTGTCTDTDIDRHIQRHRHRHVNYTQTWQHTARMCLHTSTHTQAHECMRHQPPSCPHTHAAQRINTHTRTHTSTLQAGTTRAALTASMATHGAFCICICIWRTRSLHVCMPSLNPAPMRAHAQRFVVAPHTTRPPSEIAASSP